ncbi:MAG: GntR family transcriptional regulator [Victivallaceae bacterium]|jgi:DNA-binding LacI/PurR family transcriptional regulator
MHENTKRSLRILKERIESGYWPENSFLPAERKLCQELGIGRGALLAIFQELTSMGYIRLERGRGARVSPVAKHRFRRILVIENSNFTLNHSSEHLRILDGISTMVDSIGVEMALSFADKNSSTEPLIERYARGEYQGIIIVEHFKLVNLDLLLRYGIPVVTANSEAAEKLPCTQVDFREIGRIAGRELLNHGHRNIGMLSGPADSFIFKEMLAGLKGTMAEEDILLNPKHIFFWESNGITEGMIQWLGTLPRPAALFVARDWRADKLYEACGKLNLRIPDDISVISYDDLSWPSAAGAGLSTVSEPAAELGGKAVLMLKEWVETGKQPDSIKVHGQLIRRTSIKNLNPDPAPCL